MYKRQTGFQYLTYQRYFPVFAGSTLPVKKLGWADMYSSMGITGVTFGLTGEACVNPDTYVAWLPFTMCHEIAHRQAVAAEDGANFCAYLACMENPDAEFQYSGALAAYISDESVVNFQLMNVNFGIMPALGYRVKGKANKNLAIANRSLAVIDAMTGKTKEESHENSR